MYHNKAKLANHLQEALDDINLGDNEEAISINKLLTPQQRYYLVMNIIRYLPKTDHEKVIEFHNTFKVDKETTHIVDEFKYKKLRFDLLLEEVIELGHALGLANGEMYQSYIRLNDEVLKKGIEVGLTEVMDALTDISYVLHGAFDVFNLNDINFEAMEEVHSSNMSKLLPLSIKEEELKQVIGRMKENGITAITEKTNAGYVVRNAETNKVMKPITYRPADLKPIINNYLKNGDK